MHSHPFVLTPHETQYVWDRATGMMPAVGPHGLTKCLAHAIGEVLYARGGHPEIRIAEIHLFHGGTAQAVVDPLTGEITVTPDGHA